jgi:glycosyltransferase involved in cell wall biosynthesis/SAM-dependent methyltransferase
MRLAYFTPLPPSKSGIADYNAELLPFLAAAADITVFVEKQEEINANQNQPYRVTHHERFAAQHAERPYDLVVYHQGNNPYHEYIYEHALVTPGLLVLHEHCLHHLLAWKMLGRNQEEAFADELFYAYGSNGARLALARDRDTASEYQQFVFPLNRKLVNRQLGIVVHNEYAASQLELEPGHAPVRLINHHLSPRVAELDALDQNECRRALDLPLDAWIVASFGYVTLPKRIPTMLRAFKHIAEIVPNALCLIVGEDHARWSAQPLIKELGLEKQARITGYTLERDFFRYLKAVDVVINLRFPTAGETSGTLIRSLGAGKPVIVSDFGQFGDLPDDICLKVSLDPKREERELIKQLRLLAARPPISERLSRNAYATVREQHDIRRSAAQYLSFAEQIVTSRKPRINAPTLAFTGEEPTIKFDHDEALAYVKGFFADDPNAAGYVARHGKRLLRTLELLPAGKPSQCVLELSSYMQMPPLMRRYGHYGEIVVTNWWQGEPREIQQSVSNPQAGETISLPMRNLDVERERFPFAEASFDVALCCELIEHLQEDPMHMLWELNRVLKWGGLVVITTPNVTSAFSIKEAMAGNSPYIYGAYNRGNRADRHSREYTPNDIRTALVAAGFKVTHLAAEDVWHDTDREFQAWLEKQTGIPTSLRGDNIYAVGRKLSAQLERYPASLYD